MATQWTDQDQFGEDVDYYDNDNDYYDSDTDYYDSLGISLTTWLNTTVATSDWESRGVDGSLLDYDDPDDDMDDTEDTITGAWFTDWTNRADP